MTRRTATFWTLGALAALLACGALTLQFLVDPERVKKAAADRARTHWERELLLGDVRFSLFPLPSLRASKVSLANPAWAKEPHLFQAEFVRADLELLPLLVGKVRVKSLALDGVKAGLEVDDKGEVSWALKSSAPPAPAKADEPDDPLQIATVHIRDARIVHRKGRKPAEPWHIQEAVIESTAGTKDVRVDAKVARFGRTLQVKAQLADLSRLGEKGGVTDGEVHLDWGRAQASAKGKFPLHADLAGQDIAASVKAESLQEVFEFFGVKRGKTAPFEMKLRAREDGGRVQVNDFAATLGGLALKGSATLTREPRLVLHAKLAAERLDWLKTLVDAGGTIKPPRRDGEVFHEDPVAWRAVTSIGAVHGTADLSIASFRMGNGLELRDFKGKAEFGDGRVQLAPFSAQMLGGAAKGALRFDGRKKTVRFELDGDRLLLERWFQERGSKIPFKGGPMRVRADLSLAGATYRDLAASVTGAFVVRMGPGVWGSKRAGEYEEVMVRALLPKDGQDVQFQCAAADLRFKDGRASGKEIVAARTDVSQLITSGSVDFRAETLDLRGKVISRSGLRVGLGMLASDVQVTGRLAKPTIQFDPDAKPMVVARAASAIATAGASLLGSALYDAAESQRDPCSEVFK